ncbi:hypothetical protein HPB47_017844 [Ixodes persulcatus]|uniref:Uncharacterized protein n=1 Tax=Ixodes persulcatus TaxID=34615 RepID=A0AC60QME0_IXOPE|nr:hypothetical protein HPB47_017844 [Ixodes persulcatus]
MRGVLEEVDDAVQKDGITYDTLQAMTYLEASIKEAMRMYTADSLFLPQNKDNIRPFTNLAFGAGPRNCVGMRLAMVQAKVALGSILRHFKFHACQETMVSSRLVRYHVS